MCSVPTKKQVTRTMSAAVPASNYYNPTQTTPFDVKIELMNKETDGSARHFGFFKLTTSAFPEGHKKEATTESTLRWMFRLQCAKRIVLGWQKIRL